MTRARLQTLAIIVAGVTLFGCQTNPSKPGESSTVQPGYQPALNTDEAGLWLVSESELVDAIVDAFSLSGSQRVQAKNLRPAPFGSINGFRFELEFMNDDGLKKNGSVIGTVVDESLYLIIYTGASIHYFPKYAQEFEAIVSSIRTKMAS